MSPIAILQEIRIDTEQLLAQLESGSSRFYEITADGTLTECTPTLRQYYRHIVRNVQHLIDLLHHSPPAARL